MPGDIFTDILTSCTCIVLDDTYSIRFTVHIGNNILNIIHILYH